MSPLSELREPVFEMGECCASIGTSTGFFVPGL